MSTLKGVGVSPLSVLHKGGRGSRKSSLWRYLIEMLSSPDFMRDFAVTLTHSWSATMVMISSSLGSFVAFWGCGVREHI